MTVVVGLEVGAQWPTLWQLAAVLKVSWGDATEVQSEYFHFPEIKLSL